MQPLNGGAGYTLIELLVVIGILAILAAIAMPSYFHHRDAGKLKASQTEFSSLKAGLAMFHADVGRYPTTQEGLTALLRAPRSVPQWSGPYLRRSEVLVDSWSHNFEYNSPGGHGEYDLYSYGPAVDHSQKPAIASW